jgi:hypothetical protein
MSVVVHDSGDRKFPHSSLEVLMSFEEKPGDHCSFCGKTRSEVKALVAAAEPGVFICENDILLVLDIAIHEGAFSEADITPRLTSVITKQHQVAVPASSE